MKNPPLWLLRLLRIHPSPSACVLGKCEVCRRNRNCRCPMVGDRPFDPTCSMHGYLA